MDQSKPVVVITGAAGHVGTILAEALCERYEVVGLDQPGKTASVPLVPVDLTSDSSVDQALSTLRDRYGARWASVIHLAAFFDFSGEPNPLYHQLDVEGTKRLLVGLQRFDVGQFVFSSTMLVSRGAKPGEAIDENTPVEPTWPYPEAKAAAEEVIRQHHGAVPYVIMRLAGLYDDTSVIGVLAHQIARIRERELESHVYAGSLKTQQSMIHRDDLSSAIKAIVDRRADLPRDTVMLLGEPEPPTYQELQDIIGEELHGKDWLTVRMPATIAAVGTWVQDKVQEHLPASLGGTDKPFLRPYMMKLASDNYALDIGRAKHLLDWEPRRRLKATLPTILAALKRDPKAWYKRNDLTFPDN